MLFSHLFRKDFNKKYIFSNASLKIGNYSTSSLPSTEQPNQLFSFVKTSTSTLSYATLAHINYENLLHCMKTNDIVRGEMCFKELQEIRHQIDRNFQTRIIIAMSSFYQQVKKPSLAKKILNQLPSDPITLTKPVPVSTLENVYRRLPKRVFLQTLRFVRELLLYKRDFSKAKFYMDAWREHLKTQHRVAKVRSLNLYYTMMIYLVRRPPQLSQNFDYFKELFAEVLEIDPGPENPYFHILFLNGLLAMKDVEGALKFMREIEDLPLVRPYDTVFNPLMAILNVSCGKPHPIMDGLIVEMVVKFKLFPPDRIPLIIGEKAKLISTTESANLNQSNGNASTVEIYDDKEVPTAEFPGIIQQLEEQQQPLKNAENSTSAAVIIKNAGNHENSKSKRKKSKKSLTSRISLKRKRKGSKTNGPIEIMKTSRPLYAIHKELRDVKKIVYLKYLLNYYAVTANEEKFQLCYDRIQEIVPGHSSVYVPKLMLLDRLERYEAVQKFYDELPTKALRNDPRILRGLFTMFLSRNDGYRAFYFYEKYVSLRRIPKFAKLRNGFPVVTLMAMINLQCPDKVSVDQMEKILTRDITYPHVTANVDVIPRLANHFIRYLFKTKNYEKVGEFCRGLVPGEKRANIQLFYEIIVGYCVAGMFEHAEKIVVEALNRFKLKPNFLFCKKVFYVYLGLKKFEDTEKLLLELEKLKEISNTDIPMETKNKVHLSLLQKLQNVYTQQRMVEKAKQTQMRILELEQSLQQKRQDQKHLKDIAEFL